MAVNFYKACINVNFKKDVNLDEKWASIEKCAWEFSLKRRFKKLITLIDIKDNSLDFAIVSNSKIELEKSFLRIICSYLKDLCSLFNVTYDSKKKYFSILEFASIDNEEYKRLTDKMQPDKTNMEYIKETVQAVNCPNEIYETEDVILPKRSFPTIETSLNRTDAAKKKGVKEFKSYKEVLSSLESLIGLSGVKEKIKSIAEFIIQSNRRYAQLNIEDPELYYNVAISGNKGCGKDTIAKLIFQLFIHLGVIGAENLICLDDRDIMPGSSLNRNIGNEQSGMVLINDIQYLKFNERRGIRDFYSTFDEWFTKYKNNFVFIVTGEPERMKEIMKEHKLRKHINFEINIPDYNDNEMLDLIRYFAEREKYTVSNDAEKEILKSINYYKLMGNFENAYTAKLLVEKAIIQKHLEGKTNILTSEDFINSEIPRQQVITLANKNDEMDPFEELEGMIGLHKVKKIVKEISSYAAVQVKRKKLGLEAEPVCLHMCFTGSPGSGKTSVARCIGKIFKRLGVLSKGDFIEVAREDLVGKYVGHTAQLTAQKLEEAKGGILFVDEAYSLSSASKIDFGYEAVSTLVKKMEDMRNNLVVIFAGYKEEMEEFINMNPGLKHRIQFNIDFPDYNSLELFDMWRKFFKNNKYTVDKEALKEMKKITKLLFDYKDHNFSNGRIVRKCFERAKMYQSLRIINKGLTTAEELSRITAEDIKKIYDDEDFINEIGGSYKKKCIGFVG